MAQDRFQVRIETAAKKRGFNVRWEKLIHNARRAVIDTDRTNHESIYAWAKRIKNVHVWDWTAVSPYAFTGRVYIMAQNEWDTFRTACSDEQKRNEAWCQRFHTAAEIIGQDHAGEIAESTETVDEAVQTAHNFQKKNM